MESFQNLKVKVDYTEYMVVLHYLGKSTCYCAHGKSNSKAIQNAIFQAINKAGSSNLDNIIEQD